jgi:Cof subfamily protein (haloacid dehalogenase superfamily)
MKYKLIALDLDGTLLGKDRKVSAANRAALDRAAAAGMHVMINTGRVLPEAEACVAGLDSVSLIAGCNGAVVKDRRSGVIVYERPLLAAACASVARAIEAGKLFYSVYGKDRVFYARATLERFPSMAPFVEGMACPRAVVDDLPGELESGRVEPLKVFALSLAPGEIARTRARIAEIEALELSSSYSNNVEVTAAGVDKGSALRAVCELYGIPLELTVAMGDGENDLSMLASVGLSIAMANASAEVRGAANFVTASNAEDGVAAAIERYAFP